MHQGKRDAICHHADGGELDEEAATAAFRLSGAPARLVTNRTSVHSAQQRGRTCGKGGKPLKGGRGRDILALSL
jgi:hypothetical protein